METVKKISVSYYAERNKDFSVEVKAWIDERGKWNWNIYAYFFPTFDRYEDNEFLKNIEMAGGVTFDELKTTQPLEGLQYDFQKVRETKIIGCDFAHSWDDYDNHPSPFEYTIGVIPEPFLGHAERLISQLKLGER